jgi:hypothetical protein
LRICTCEEERKKRERLEGKDRVGKRERKIKKEGEK